MKKFLKIITAAAILLCGFTLAGCAAAQNLKDALSGPKDTWFRKEMNYTSGSNSTQIVVYMCYSDNGYSADDLESTITVGPGLTVVVISKDQSEDPNPIIAGLTKGKYLMQTFSNSSETEIEGGTDDGTDTSSKSIKMSTAKWNVIYNSVKMEEQPGTINPLQKDTAWEKLTKPTSFSWKKILANYALEKLLNE